MPGFDKRFGGFVRRSGIEMPMGAEDNRGEVDPAPPLPEVISNDDTDEGIVVIRSYAKTFSFLSMAARQSGGQAVSSNCALSGAAVFFHLGNNSSPSEYCTFISTLKV
jgi:hypothetical protein